MKTRKLIPRQKGAFRRCSWKRRDVILFSTVWKIKASRENSRELLGDDVMKTASHRNCTVQVTVIEFEQLLYRAENGRWEFVFTLQSHFVDFSQNHYPVYSLQYNTTECQIWFTAVCKL